MEDAFSSFYRTLDPSRFKYFVKDGCFYVYNEDIAHLPDELKPKSEKSASMRLQSIENVVRELLTVKRIPVEEYCDYKLTKKGFPGNFGDFLDICIGENIPPTVFAVSERGDAELDVAFVRDSKIFRCRFLDDDLLSNLFSLCSSNNCIEILISNPDLERVFISWGIECTISKFKDSGEMLCRHMRAELETVQFERENCCIVNIADFDLVDFGLATAQGKRLVNQWLRSPSVNQADIERRLDLVEAFSRINVSVGRFSDLKRAVARINNRSITPRETVKLCQTLQQADELLDAFTASQPVHSLVAEAFIAPLESLRGIFAPLVDKIRSTLNFNTARVHTHLSEELKRLGEQRFEILADVEKEYLRVKQDYPKVSFSNKCFKISRLEYNQSSFDSKRYLVVSMLKTGVSFLTKKLSDLNERLSLVEAEVTGIEGRIFITLVGVLGGFVGSLESLNYLVALADVYKGFSAKVGSEMYSRPVFSTGEYRVEEMHHPLLEHRGCILNSIEFTKNVCVLTGPNMGGKSTFIKALSTVSLYAQIGCYVPAKHAVLPIFDKIFLRIGARDCASRKLSTFMVEMTDLNRILRTATTRSLVLIDELGRGTSAIDGVSLALSVRDHLIRLGAKVVMATHFSELGCDETLNKKMRVETNVLTYKVDDGICDLSFGLNVAELARFPSEVLAAAKQYLG